MDWVFLRAMFAAYQIRVETDKFGGAFGGAFAVRCVKNLGRALPQSKKPARGAIVLAQHIIIIALCENSVKPVEFGSVKLYNLLLKFLHSPVVERRTILRSH